MTRTQRLELLKQIEKDIHVCSLESTLLDDAKSCAIHSAIEELEQEPCDDAISRKEVIRITAETGALETQGRVKALPSVTPKQKMGFDGMTNGEVIELLFPNTVIYHNLDFTLREMIFSDEWWDEPYKAESEE